MEVIDRETAYTVFHVGSGEMEGARPPHFRPKTPHFFARAFGAGDHFSHMSVLSGFCAFYTIYSVIKRFMTLFGVLYTILMLWATI